MECLRGIVRCFVSCCCPNEIGPTQDPYNEATPLLRGADHDNVRVVHVSPDSGFTVDEAQSDPSASVGINDFSSDLENDLEKARQKSPLTTAKETFERQRVALGQTMLGEVIADCDAHVIDHASAVATGNAKSENRNVAQVEEERLQAKQLKQRKALYARKLSAVATNAAKCLAATGPIPEDGDNENDSDINISANFSPNNAETAIQVPREMLVGFARNQRR